MLYGTPFPTADALTVNTNWNLRINFYLLRTFCPYLGSFLCCFFFHYISAKFHLWPGRSERRNNTKNYQDEDKKSTINKN